MERLPTEHPARLRRKRSNVRAAPRREERVKVRGSEWELAERVSEDPRVARLRRVNALGYIARASPRKSLRLFRTKGIPCSRGRSPRSRKSLQLSRLLHRPGSPDPGYRESCRGERLNLPRFPCLPWAASFRKFIHTAPRSLWCVSWWLPDSWFRARIGECRRKKGAPAWARLRRRGTLVRQRSNPTVKMNWRGSLMRQA